MNSTPKTTAEHYAAIAAAAITVNDTHSVKHKPEKMPEGYIPGSLVTPAQIRHQEKYVNNRNHKCSCGSGKKFKKCCKGK